jgi:PIN domain nuclease of toxin-antitoxin system
MRYLIDSHVLLWLIAESEKVGSDTKKLLSNSEAQVYVSLASLWELNLKASKGRLPISSEKILEGADQLGVGIVEVQMKHIQALANIKNEHADPFDLLLCAQAKAEGMTLVTADQILLKQFKNSIDAKT